MDHYKGTKAPQAAGKIHTDLEQGLYSGGVVAYDDLIECGSHNAARKRLIEWRAKTRRTGRRYHAVPFNV